MLREIATTKIADLDIREPVRVGTDATVGAAVERMRKANQGAVVVEDTTGVIVGILTDRDVVTRLATTDGWRDRTLADSMTPQPRTVAKSSSIGEAIRLMSRGTFRHLPVVDDKNHAVGMASIRDIITHIAQLFPEEFINLPPDPSHETSGPWGG